MKTVRFAALSSLIITAASHPAAAQTALEPPTQLAPVVVTSDLWATTLARTSASATVFTAGELAAHGRQAFGDLVDATPNLTWTAGTSRARYFQIRGIGENSQFEGETPDSSVRFLIDDLDFTGLGGAASLFDAQQVEVLRGPQAGAFGANAAGGVIKIVTADPTPYVTGYAEGTVASDDHFSGTVAAGGPLLTSDPSRLTYRFAAQRTLANGFRDNAFLGRDDTNQIDELSLRLKVRFRPSDVWQWDATAFYADQDNGYDEFTLDNSGFTTYSDEAGHDTQESAAGSLRGTFTGSDAVAFTTKTSFTTADSLYSYDSDWTYAADPRGYDSFVELQRTRDVFNQELRLDSPATTDAEALRWTVGAYYESLNEDTFLTRDFGDAHTTFDARTTALFGQIGYAFSSTSRLIVGLRAEDYDLDTTIEFRDNVDYADTLFGGKVTFEHDLSDTQLVFASVTRGYKAGGANIYNYLVVPDDGPAGYDTETMWNTELGWRGHSADGRFSGELVGFYLDRQDPQVRDSAGFGSAFTYFVDNGQSADIYGLESSFRATVVEGFSIHGSLGLMHSQIDAFRLHNADASPAGGRELANVPAYTYSVGARYDADGGLFSSIELSGRDAYFESNTHDERRSSYNLVNASLGYRGDHWSVTVWAKNLFDEYYEKRIFYFGNAGPDYATKRYESPADPRQVGASVRYSF